MNGEVWTRRGHSRSMGTLMSTSGCHTVIRGTQYLKHTLQLGMPSSKVAVMLAQVLAF